jgi:hypothetical protein
MYSMYTGPVRKNKSSSLHIIYTLFLCAKEYLYNKKNFLCPAIYTSVLDPEPDPGQL